MVLRSGRLWLAGLLLLAAAGAADERSGSTAAPPAANGQVTLPLKEYLVLLDTAERIERRRAEEALHREAAASEIAVERLRARIEDVADRPQALLTAELEVVIQGRQKEPLPLPLTGFPSRLEVVRGAATAAVSAGGTGPVLVASAPGHYTVRAEGRVALEASAGESRLAFARIAAPVAELEVELPAELAWSLLGAVPVDERVENGRRQLRLSAKRGEAPRLTLRRKVDGSEADRLLAECVVLTIVQLRPEGPRRHDVVLYEVARGALADLEVELPPGLTVEQAATDEGTVVPDEDGRRLTVHRRRQLQGTGYLVLTSTPEPAAALALDAVRPGPAVRARYLALATTVAATTRPLPAASWERVDLDDLPSMLGEALQALDLTAAWRLTTGGAAGATPAAGPATPSAAGSESLSLSVAVLAPAGRLETVVRLRETTTLLTVDGTLLHRDYFWLGQAGAALDLSLPPGATLWSAKVGAQAVRPLERGGVISVPLGSEVLPGAAPPVVEVVSVLERALPSGRSRLDLELAQVRSPVLAHRWHLLLPEDARYRFRAGDLQPVPPPSRPAPPPPGAAAGMAAGEPVGATVAPSELQKIPTTRDAWEVLRNTPGVQVDRVNVGGNESGQVATYAESPLLDERKVEAHDFDSFGEVAAGLKQGLVGGVKPLPVSIPASGKSLLLSGVLPPPRVAVELEVKGKR
jgi:hypothetical protein